jgi:hypothetical protein
LIHIIFPSGNSDLTTTCRRKNSTEAAKVEI